MQIKSLFSSKIFFLGLLALFVFLGVLKFRQYQGQKQIQAEEQKLTEQTKLLQQKNQELSDSLSYLNSSSFKERVARQQLNLKKNGEDVYSFGDNPAAAASAQASPSSGSNWQKWLNYFFKSGS